jgi:hypothetical protein
MNLKLPKNRWVLVSGGFGGGDFVQGKGDCAADRRVWIFESFGKSGYGASCFAAELCKCRSGRASHIRVRALQTVQKSRNGEIWGCVEDLEDRDRYELEHSVVRLVSAISDDGNGDSRGCFNVRHVYEPAEGFCTARVFLVLDYREQWREGVCSNEGQCFGSSERGLYWVRPIHNSHEFGDCGLCVVSQAPNGPCGSLGPCLIWRVQEADCYRPAAESGCQWSGEFDPPGGSLILNPFEEEWQRTWPNFAQGICSFIGRAIIAPDDPVAERVTVVGGLRLFFARQCRNQNDYCAQADCNEYSPLSHVRSLRLAPSTLNSQLLPVRERRETGNYSGWYG